MAPQQHMHTWLFTACLPVHLAATPHTLNSTYLHACAHAHGASTQLSTDYLVVLQHTHMAQPSCKTLIGACSLMHLSFNTAHNFPAPLAAAGHRCAPLVCSLEARPSTAAAQVGAAKLIVHACKMHQGAGEGLAWFRGVAGVLHACHGLSTCMHASMSTLHLCSSLARHSCRRAMWGGGFDGEGGGEGLPGSGRELVCCAHAITSANTCMRASARCGFAV